MKYWKSEKREDKGTLATDFWGEGAYNENALYWSTHIYEGTKGGSFMEVCSVHPKI